MIIHNKAGNKTAADWLSKWLPAIQDYGMADGTEGKQADIARGAGVTVQRAVAAGLRQRLAPDTSPVPDALQRLLDELRRQEAVAAGRQ